MMTPTPTSAGTTAPELAALQPNELLDRLALDEDRAPFELMEACVAHGDRMVDALRRVIDDEYTWVSEDSGDWWLLLHAAFILGRIRSEAAGHALAYLMQCMDEHDDDNLQDWLADEWPELFANKPRSAVEAVRDLSADPSLGWFARCEGLQVVLDAGIRDGDAALEQAIDWIAALAADESADWVFRAFAACALLDFPRGRHRALLATIADEEEHRYTERGEFGPVFMTGDVETAYRRGTDQPRWRGHGDPWAFYDPDAIAERQRRWRDEDPPDPEWDAPAPYVRATPKVGRNDPCPCGSGKKYKRCCLARDEATARNFLE